MKRHDLIYRNQLRPGLILNLVLMTVLLAGFGLAHGWLGVRYHQKGEDIKRLEAEAVMMENQIRELEVKTSNFLNPGWLAKQKDALHLDLRRIVPNEPVELAETQTVAPAPATTN